MRRDAARFRPGVRTRLLGFVLASMVVLVLPAGRFAVLEREQDDPDAAEAYENAKRAPRDAAVDPARLYAAAVERVGRLPRFSSRIARELSDLQPHARLWATGARMRVLDDGAASALLDAWTPLGPGNIGGRTRVVRYHPTSPNVIFAAGVSGGVWKTDDNAITWRPMADGLANIAVNALVIDPNEPDVMFAGTGEGYFREEIRNTGLPLRGSGIFITRDGGREWQQLRATSAPDFHWVNDLELGLGDSRIVYAATRTGVWRSLDRGTAWQRLLEVNVRGGCLDLALRRDGGHDVLFATCGSYEPASIYRFPAAEIDARVELVLREPGQGRTSLAIAPSNADVIYALAASNDPGPQGNYRQALLAVYRSVRGGAAGTWETRVSNQDPTRLNTLLLTNVSGATVQDCGSQAPNSFTNMGWYTNVIAVDPRDPNRVWAAGVDWFRSDDGGVTWGLVSSQATPATSIQTPVHVDQHGFAFHPGYDGESNQTLIVANDGGLFRTTTARARATTGTRAGCSPVTIELQWQSLNRGYGVTQFYHGLPFPDGERYFGGAQDNGTVLGSDGAGADGWRGIFGGDGGYVAIDPANANVLYAETQWAALVKSTNGGLSFAAATRGLDAIQSDVLGPEANYLFVAPYVMDPSNAQRLWLGGEYLYRTTNAATQWGKASALVPDGGLVSTIAIAAQDANRVVAGTHRGHVLSTRRALESTSTTVWSASRPREGWVTSVTLDPDNPDIVYATYGNFGGSHVFRSDDGGANWRSLDGSGDRALPDIPVHSLVVDFSDRSRVYLGTDLGVFDSTDGGARWMIEETGFGPVVTEWLSLIRDTSGRRRLFAFTHGRGVWRVDLR
jgi:hypothetical protein